MVLDSTLPKINIGEKFHIVHGQGHNSIVTRVAEEQMDSCFEWIEKFQAKNNRSSIFKEIFDRFVMG